MMWKRMFLAVVGAGMLGAAASESNAEAAPCPQTCTSCSCTDTIMDVTADSYWNVVGVLDTENHASFIQGKRQKISGGSALQRRSMDYEVLQIGSSHHTGFAWVHCSGSTGDPYIDGLGKSEENIVSTLSCPAGTTWVHGLVGLTITGTVCPAEDLICHH